MKIVLFDDQKIILDALKSCFQLLLHDAIITTFTQSVPLLTHLEQHKANVIVIDLITDEDLGFAVIEKSISKQAQSIIVIYSNVSMPFIIEMVTNLGIDLYIHKSTPVMQTAELILHATKTKNLLDSNE